MSRPGHETVVAVDGDLVVGFVVGFTTLSERGEHRLEVDLLAVDPAWQGRGIGRELVRCLTEIDTDADFARALIRVGNVGSERAFAACGYAPEVTTTILYVASAEGRDIHIKVDGLHLIPVETFTYSGVWLEGQHTSENLRLARHGIGQGIVGAVIPSADALILAPEAAGFERISEYRWWRHDYSGRC